MSALSQFLNGGASGSAGPIGSIMEVSAVINDNLIVNGETEYLKAGGVVPYDPKYATAVSKGFGLSSKAVGFVTNFRVIYNKVYEDWYKSVSDNYYRIDASGKYQWMCDTPFYDGIKPAFNLMVVGTSFFFVFYNYRTYKTATSQENYFCDTVVAKSQDGKNWTFTTVNTALNSAVFNPSWDSNTPESRLISLGNVNTFPVPLAIGNGNSSLALFNENLDMVYSTYVHFLRLRAYYGGYLCSHSTGNYTLDETSLIISPTSLTPSHVDFQLNLISSEDFTIIYNTSRGQGGTYIFTKKTSEAVFTSQVYSTFLKLSDASDNFKIYFNLKSRYFIARSVSGGAATSITNFGVSFSPDGQSWTGVPYSTGGSVSGSFTEVDPFIRYTGYIPCDSGLFSTDSNYLVFLPSVTNKKPFRLDTSKPFSKFVKIGSNYLTVGLGSQTSGEKVVVVLSSPDLVTWNVASIKITTGISFNNTNNIFKVVNGTLIFNFGSNSDRLFSTTDGITVTETILTQLSSGVYDICYFKGNYLIGGSFSGGQYKYASTIAGLATGTLVSTSASVIFSFATSPTTLVATTNGTPFAIVSSTGLSGSWSNCTGSIVSEGQNGYDTSVIYDGTKFVYSVLTSGFVVRFGTSVAGSAFTSSSSIATIDTTAKSFTNFLYADNKYYLGLEKTGVVYSSDLLTWFTYNSVAVDPPVFGTGINTFFSTSSNELVFTNRVERPSNGNLIVDGSGVGVNTVIVPPVSTTGDGKRAYVRIK